jgi:hypothetical protein
MKSLVHAGTALSVLALGFAGFAGTASAAAIPFEVCSPLGCAVQSVRGTVDSTGGQVRVSATVTDSSPTSKLTAQFAVSPPSAVYRAVADNEAKRVVFLFPATATHLTVTACGGGGCNTKSIPL